MALLKTKEALYPNARWGDDPIWWAVIDSLSPNGSWRPDGGWLLTHKTGIRVSASFRGERKTSLEPACSGGGPRAEHHRRLQQRWNPLMQQKKCLPNPLGSAR